MPQLRIRDVKEDFDSKITEVKSELGGLTANTFAMGTQLEQKCEKGDKELQQQLSKVRSFVYVLAVIQLGLVSHLLFSVLSR